MSTPTKTVRINISGIVTNRTENNVRFVEIDVSCIFGHCLLVVKVGDNRFAQSFAIAATKF